MQKFKERLEILFGKDAGPTEIAKKIGMTFQGFTRIWYGGGVPKADTLIKIKQVTHCNLDWLLTGEGEPFLFDNNESICKIYPDDDEVDERNSNKSIDVNDFVFIPRYDIDAEAGQGSFQTEEKTLFHLAFRKFWVDNFICTNAKNLSVISVKGDSMAGVLNDGDIILVNHAQHTPADGLYVLRVGESLLVKRTQVLPEGKLLVKSTNKEYETFTLDLKNEDVAIIGKVEWFGRRI